MRFQEKEYPGSWNELDPLLSLSSGSRKRSNKAFRWALLISITTMSVILLMIFLSMLNGSYNEPPPPPPPPSPQPMTNLTEILTSSGHHETIPGHENFFRPDDHH